MPRSPPPGSRAPGSAAVIRLLRAIAALEILAAAVVAFLTLYVLAFLPPTSRKGPIALFVLGAAFAAAGVSAGMQLWRLTERGRVSSIVFLLMLMGFSTVLLFVREQPHVMVRLILEGVMLVILLSRRAREVCVSNPA